MTELGPLHGVRILDFTRYQQGPYATVMLSDLGADVLKVEEPGHGDPGRSLGLQPDGWCSYFQALNRNKRSITIDIRKPEGVELVKRLIAEYDVVTENFRPGMMEKCGVGHDALAAVNPRVITASATGFGGDGPQARRPSFDIIGQAMSGIMWNHSAASGGTPIQLTGGLAWPCARRSCSHRINTKICRTTRSRISRIFLARARRRSCSTSIRRCR